MRFRYLVLLTITCTLFLLSCSKKTSVAPINPNGDSELALLMREMYNEGMAMKKALDKNKSHEIAIAPSDILTAKATDQEKADSPLFEAFAKSYISTMDNYSKASNATDLESNYKNMVQSCTSCHTAMCPGPLVKIKKLHLE